MKTWKAVTDADGTVNTTPGQRRSWVQVALIVVTAIVACGVGPRQATAVGAPGSGTRIDLQAEEQAAGHTIAKHVGLSNTALVARNIAYASTFADLSAAETATTDNIAANQGRINKWLTGTPPTPTLAIQNLMDPADGIVYEKASQSFLSPDMVNTVLQRSSTGWFVLTSYPTQGVLR